MPVRCKARQAWLIVPSLGGEPMTKNLAQPMNFAQPKTAQLMLVPFDVTKRDYHFAIKIIL